MSTSLLQEWCTARLSALCSLSEEMAAQAEALMTEQGAAVRAGVRLEVGIIYNVCCQHQRTLASLMRKLSVPADESGLTGDATCCKSVADLASAKSAETMIRFHIRLCDLRATMAAAQFSCDELGSAFGVLGLSTHSDDLYWMRDECGAHNRRLETLVIAQRALMVAPEAPLQRVPFEPTQPLPYPSVAGQKGSFNAATDKTVHEAC